MRIAVCDDDIGVCNSIEQWINEYIEENKINIEVESYYSAESLENDFTYKDIVFLDVEFPGLNGIQLGQRIREKESRDSVAIVFISGKLTHCSQMFEMEPLNFHYKPLKREDIICDIEKILQRKKETAALQYKEDGKTRDVRIEDIVYLTSLNKKVIIRKVDGKELIFRGNLRDYAKKFQKFGLYQCHRSYIVNFCHVEKYKNRIMYTKQAGEIPVGKAFASVIREKWLRFEF